MYPILHSLDWTHLRSWDDLERAIIALPTEQARGEAFEEFCHAFLSIQKDFYQAQEVWSFQQVPSPILEKLGCSTRQDEGIDGILLHHDGTITAYQAKFRANRADVPSQRELSTFYMVSDRVDYRLILANVEDLPRVAKERKDHGQILIEELLALDEVFFSQLQEFITIGHLPEAPPPIPRPYQVQAIIAITDGLQTHPRGQAILACGAGKTFIGKWVVDRLRCRWILVMVPSLALVRQTLGEWHRAQTQAFRYLCVCSDETVDSLSGTDEWVTQLSDLDVRVSTQTPDLIQFLQRKESLPHVVFSTYQSGSVLVEALADPGLKGFQFDLAICDEAHRLAGAAGRMFNQVLDDDLIRVKKRLFMTATPKIIAPRSGTNESEDHPLELSMDDPQTFGPMLFYFGFGQAIQEKIICDYRIVVIGVAEEEIAQLVRAGGTVQMEDAETWQAENLAQRIALGKAIATYGIKKVFTFHNRVLAASRFVDARLPDGFPRILKRMAPGLDFSAQHISGEMSAGFRAKILRDFRMSPRGVVSNARCLGEGVNVPIVDGVYFADPRESLIDIVQATGRALRRIPGKETAYIIIPVLVHEEDEAEQILKDSRFQTVWKVLSAMVSQDDRLEAVIRETRIKQGESVLPVLGKDERFAPGELPDTRTVLMGFPKHIPFSKYQSLFTLEMMEKLGDRWNLRFGALKKYMERYGKEPTNKTKFEGFAIGSWLSSQRKAMKKNKLTADRFWLLNDLGIQWTRRSGLEKHEWNDYLMDCKRFQRDEGRLPNPGEIGLFGLKVGSWLHYQRKRLREGLLTKDKIDKLKDLLGVDLNLNPMIEKWKRNYAAYKDYVTSTGKQPDRRTISNDVLIGVWLDYLRKHKNALSVDQIQQLDALGIRWTKLRESTHKLLEANRTRRKLLGPYVPEEEIEEHQPAGEGWIRSYMLCKEFLSLPEDKGKLTSGAIYKNEPIGAWFELQVRRFYKNKLSPENRSRVSILLRLSEVRIRRSILKNPAD